MKQTLLTRAHKMVPSVTRNSSACLVTGEQTELGRDIDKHLQDVFDINVGLVVP